MLSVVAARTLTRARSPSATDAPSDTESSAMSSITMDDATARTAPVARCGRSRSATVPVAIPTEVVPTRTSEAPNPASSAADSTDPVSTPRSMRRRPSISPNNGAPAVSSTIERITARESKIARKVSESRPVPESARRPRASSDHVAARTSAVSTCSPVESIPMRSAPATSRESPRRDVESSISSTWRSTSPGRSFTEMATCPLSSAGGMSARAMNARGSTSVSVPVRSRRVRVVSSRLVPVRRTVASAFESVASIVRVSPTAKSSRRPAGVPRNGSAESARTRVAMAMVSSVSAASSQRVRTSDAIRPSPRTVVCAGPPSTCRRSSE